MPTDETALVHLFGTKAWCAPGCGQRRPAAKLVVDQPPFVAGPDIVCGQQNILGTQRMSRHRES